MYFHQKVQKPKIRKGNNKHIHDINLPVNSGKYGHYMRTPNTNYQAQLYEYTQQINTFDNSQTEYEAMKMKRDLTEMKFIKHAANKRFHRQVEDRVKKKLKEHEDALDKRRGRLEQLLSKDEQEFYWETIDKAQRGAETKMEEMQKRAQMLRAQRENERMEIVKQKRIQQYMHRCSDLRVSLEKKHLIESKETHLQQMRENEGRREAEREIDKMWYNVMVKEIEAKKERAMQDAIYQEFRKRDLTETWDRQIEGKRLLKAEADRVAAEDFMCMQKISEQLRREECEGEERKINMRIERAKILQDQIRKQREVMEARKKEEDALDQAYAFLATKELEREKNAVKNETVQAQREAYIYKQHLKQLKEKRAHEEKHLEALLQEYQNEINEKQKANKCKVEAARKKLNEEVLKERNLQLEYKQMAEQQKKMELADNQIMGMALQTNECLIKEQARLKRLSELQYAEDLKKQIEYNNLIKQREKEEAERQLCLAEKEEANFLKLVKDFQEGTIYKEKRHPFRRVLETSDCHCPPGQTSKSNN